MNFTRNESNSLWLRGNQLSEYMISCEMFMVPDNTAYRIKIFPCYIKSQKEDMTPQE